MNAMALGLIEVVGLPAAIAAADEAIKAAQVSLIGYEKTKGGGMIVVKLRGEIGAVKAAVAAGVMAASRVGKVFSHHVIARPADGTDLLAGQVDHRPAAEILPPAAKKPVPPDDLPGFSKQSTPAPEPHEAADSQPAQESWQPPAAPDFPLNLGPNDHQPAAELSSEAAVGVLTLEAPGEPFEQEVEVGEAEVETQPETEIETQPEAVETDLSVEDLDAGTESGEVEQSAEAEDVSCNLCGDPLCTRRKGQPHKRCIHR